MRYLLLTLPLLAACERRDTARDVSTTDTTAVADNTRAADTSRLETMSAVPDRLLGSWTARGYDAGSTRAQPFTMNWTRAPDGSMGGTIAFQGGEQYKVKVVSASDSTFVYESEPHQSPTLKAEVVTRTQARMVGDSLVGTYEAKAQSGKVLKGRFTATRGSRR
jgi:hypothetical protein